MTILYDADNFDIKEFYRYPTCVVYRIAEYDEGFHPGGDDNIKELFDVLLEETAAKLGKDIREIRDNKIAMKLVHRPTNTTLYIGYKDWNWSIGLGLSRYQTGDSIVIE